MDTRRMTVWIGVIVFLVGIALLVYFDYRPQAPGEPATTVATEGPADAATTPGAEDTAQAAADIQQEASGEEEAAAASTPTPAPEGGEESPASGTTADQQPAPAASELAADAPPPADTPAESGEVEAEIAEGAPTDGENAADAAAEQMAENAPSEGPTLSEELDGDVAEVVPDEPPVMDETDTDVVNAEPGDGVEKDTDSKTAEVAAPDAAAPAEAMTEPDPADAATPDEEMAGGMAEDEPADTPVPGDDAGEVETAMVTPDADAPPADADMAAKPADETQPDETGLSVELVPGEAEPSADSDIVAPSFDIVRVEPTGDAVIAGLAEPGSTVELMSGGEAVATAEANERGEWALALLDPLEPGAHELAIRTTSPDKSEVMISDERVAVMVPEAASEEPLVVLNTPEGPSTIVQLPEDVAGASEPDMADTEPDTADGAPDEPGETVVAAAPASEEAPPSDDAPAGETAAGAPTDGASAPVGSETDIAMAPVDGDVEDEAGTMVEEPAAETAMVDPEEEPADGAPAATSDEPEVAIADPEPEPEPEPEPVVPEVVVTAVEAETTGALFVAGTATTSENVRVYLDDGLIGEAKPSPSGTWLIEVDRDLPAGTYSVRADQIETGSGSVLARAEVPFEREVEVAILKPLTEAGGPAGAATSGTLGNPQTMIIKRRDNLWRISRRIYGKGIRWSTIYQANKDQIRNPRWIYPGQVFILPEGNTAWDGDTKIDTSGLK